MKTIVLDDRVAVTVPLAAVRAGGVAAAIASAPAGAVVLPDAETDAGIVRIADGIRIARRAGRAVVVRSAAPLAAALANVQSDGLLEVPLVPAPVPTLVACGSHAVGATAQLDRVEAAHGPAVVIPTDDAFADPVAAGRAAASAARERLAATGLAVVTTERHRRADHNTLRHGELVMQALTTAVRELMPDVEAVVAKGGITSAELARTGVGASRALVRGQVLPGVSVWDLVSAEGEERLYVVVPATSAVRTRSSTCSRRSAADQSLCRPRSLYHPRERTTARRGSGCYRLSRRPVVLSREWRAPPLIASRRDQRQVRRASSATKASTSSAVVSNEHIQRTSFFAASQS